MIFSDNLQALLIAVCGGVVAALYKLSYERKQSGSSYDWIDFVLLSVTASFAGVIGFLLASWKFGDPFIILAATGIASTGGYPMLVGIKDSVFKVLKDRLTQPVMGAGARKSGYPAVDDYVGFTDPATPGTGPYKGPERRKANRRSTDPRIEP